MTKKLWCYDDVHRGTHSRGRSRPFSRRIKDINSYATKENSSRCLISSETCHGSEYPDECSPPTNLKKNLPGNLWPDQKFRCTLALRVTKRGNNWEFSGFQIPPIFCISQLPPSNRILKKNLGFQIPPIFCISQLAPSKRILIFLGGFQIPPIFCISQKES
jgi:hypothetical protein